MGSEARHERIREKKLVHGFPAEWAGLDVDNPPCQCHYPADGPLRAAIMFVEQQCEQATVLPQPSPSSGNGLVPPPIQVVLSCYR
jgi:hypothetical protein